MNHDSGSTQKKNVLLKLIRLVCVSLTVVLIGLQFFFPEAPSQGFHKVKLRDSDFSPILI
jgi:hypothetical protein